MKAPIPRLEDYDVFPNSGFLPQELPVKRLTNPYYEPWERIADNLPALILTKRLRSFVEKLPELSIDALSSVREQRRAYSILGFIAHGYIWCDGDNIVDTLPQQLAKPWIEVSEKLRLPPIATYAGLCLWNFTTIIPSDSPEDWDLESLATLNTFTGSIDESWFYLVSTCFERVGARCLDYGLKAIQAVRDDDTAAVVAHLQSLAESIDRLIGILARMPENCDPHVFYFRIRPFLAGWKNMAEAGLPHGVRYGDEKEYRSYAGGSNAQSSLIQALDILLNVEHHPTGEKPRKDAHGSTTTVESAPMKKSNSHNFIDEMRKYMPGQHRDFLLHLTQVAEIRYYVLQHKESHPELVLSYDACLAMLRSFRNQHIRIVSQYIIVQARKGSAGAGAGSSAGSTGNETKKSGLAKAKSSTKGTGGTSLIPFLKQARDETGDVAAGSWGRRLLCDANSGMPDVSVKRLAPEKTTDEGVKKQKQEVVGLAGKWVNGKEKVVHHW